MFQTLVFESTTELDELVPILVEPVQWLDPSTMLVTWVETEVVLSGEINARLGTCL